MKNRLGDLLAYVRRGGGSWWITLPGLAREPLALLANLVLTLPNAEVLPFFRPWRLLARSY